MSKELIDLACKCAINSELLQKHGSVLVCASNIFTGYNHFKYSIHSKQSKLCVPIHAEEDAINNFILYCRKKHFNDLYIRKLLNKSILIIIRVKNDQLKTSTPCFHCIKMIKHYGIKTIIYSDTGNNNNTHSNTHRNTHNDIDNTRNNECINTNNKILIKKKIRDINNNRESSGNRWRSTYSNPTTIHI